MTFFCKPSSSRGLGHERMGHTGLKGKPQPQATLSFTPGGLPVLDPCPRPAKPQAARNTSWSGQVWNQLTNIFTSSPPVYLFNPQMGRDCQQLTMPYQGVSYSIVDPGGGLWHAAGPGGLQHQQQQMMEPLHMLQCHSVLPPNKVEVPVYTSSCPPPPAPVKTSSKPLNPYAQEWVPREYRKLPTSLCEKNEAPNHHPVHTSVVPDTCHDFCEITDKEVEEARISGCVSPLNTPTSCSNSGVRKCQDIGEEVTLNLTNNTKGIEVSEGKSTCLESTLLEERKVGDAKQSSQNPLCTWENSVSSDVCERIINEIVKKSGSPEHASESKAPCSLENGSSPTVVCERFSQKSTVPASPERCTRPNHTQPSSATSLTPELMKNQRNRTLTNQAAHIASENHRLTPERHENIVRANLEVPSHQCLGSATGNSSSLSYAGVVGRSSPSPPPPVESSEQQKYKGVDQPLPKIFLQDTVPTREGDAPRIQSKKQVDLFRRPSRTQRTQTRKFLQELKESSQNGDSGDSGVCCSSSPSTSDDQSSPITSPCAVFIPASSPQAIPIPVASPGVVESPGRARSSSESSVGSLDIEFVEQDEVDRATLKTPPIKTVGLGGGNGLLACFLGSGDSDSEEEEEEEEESDLDWDDEGKDAMPQGLDDSWETFGFGLVVLECQMVPLQNPQCPAEESGSDPFLRDVNKRWEEEIRKDIRERSPKRVTFGGEKVQRMVVWDHAYREARRGPWEQQARDRTRFAQRVATLEPELSKVLEPGHRRAMYRRLCAPPPQRCFL